MGLQNYRTTLLKTGIVTKLTIRIDNNILPFYQFILKDCFNKNSEAKFDITDSSGGKEKLTFFVYFPWPSFEAGLSISPFCFL